MLLAVATRERAACLRRHVGAILVSDQRIIATGYNGTPTGFPNCDEGGCHRCSHPEDYAEGADTTSASASTPSRTRCSRRPSSATACRARSATRRCARASGA